VLSMPSPTARRPHAAVIQRRSGQHCGVRSLRKCHNHVKGLAWSRARGPRSVRTAGAAHIADDQDTVVGSFGGSHVSDIWYYADADGQVGPLTLQELRQELAAFSNANDVLVWCDHFTDWKPASDVPELRALPPTLPRGNVKVKRPHDPVIVRVLLFLGIVAVVAAAAAINVKKPNEVESLLRAANQGGAEAQNDLGIMYENGSGVPQNYVTAVAWYRKAADQVAIAQYNLGTMYEYGEGVPKDDAEALTWYRKAADQGDADAKEQLMAMPAGADIILHFGSRVTLIHATEALVTCLN
jgi:GYF domain 2/Sel1 repeat